ncbi:MAG: EcsC family protein, partial [Actinomycetota bacterium]|nr:EcsC family protein [Actinomycetota bacterium]
RPSTLIRGWHEMLEPYERSVLDEVQQWLNHEPRWMDRMLGGVSSRSRQVLDLVLETGPGRSALKAATDRASAALEDAVLRDLENDVAPVVPDDPEGREAALRQADERAGELRNRYVGALGVQGALAGAASLTVPLSVVALVADVSSAVVVPLRASAHLLAVYGGVRSHQAALQAAVDVVALATETDLGVRKGTTAALSRRLAEQRLDADTAGQLPRIVLQQTSSRALRETLEQTVRRVLRRRLARLVPLLGGAAGGAASGWLAARTCEASRQVGRVAFLVRHTPLELEDVLGEHAGPAVT